MNKFKWVALVAAVALLSAGGGVGAMWWVQQPHAPSRPAGSDIVYKYLSLDKTIVMLRGRASDGDPQHFLAIDLVFRTAAGNEAATREQLPLLRSVAVRTLANHTYENASALTIDQVADELNKAFKASYAKEGREQPFVEAMVGKFLIE
jgi:flagellar FliL protein